MLMLAASLALLNAPQPAPWMLRVARTEGDYLVWSEIRFQSAEECAEHIIPVILSSPKVVTAYCERDPHVT